MPKIKINSCSIPETNVTKFESKGKLVDEHGLYVNTDYKGYTYRIIAKNERPFSIFERLGRASLGFLFVICAGALASLASKHIRHLITKDKERLILYAGFLSPFFSKSVRDLFTQNKVITRYAVLEREPKLLFGGTKIEEDQYLNFALITTNGNEKLVAVTGSYFGKECEIYKGSPFEALLKLAKDIISRSHFFGDRHYGSPIGNILNHPANSIITKEEWFKFILENDEDNVPRICTLNPSSTLEVLQIAKEANIPMLSMKDLKIFHSILPEV